MRHNRRLQIFWRKSPRNFYQSINQSIPKLGSAFSVLLHILQSCVWSIYYNPEWTKLKKIRPYNLKLDRVIFIVFSVVAFLTFSLVPCTHFQRLSPFWPNMVIWRAVFLFVYLNRIWSMELPLWELGLMVEESTVQNPEKSVLYRETALTWRRK